MLTITNTIPASGELLLMTPRCTQMYVAAMSAAGTVKFSSSDGRFESGSFALKAFDFYRTAGLGSAAPRFFDQVSITAPAGTTFTINVGDDTLINLNEALAGSVVVTNTVAVNQTKSLNAGGAADVSVAAGATTTILAAGATRRRALLKLIPDGARTVQPRIGGNGVTGTAPGAAAGLLVGDGEIIELKTGAEIQAHNPDPAQAAVFTIITEGD